jgi:hypothetical protein
MSAKESAPESTSDNRVNSMTSQITVHAGMSRGSRTAQHTAATKLKRLSHGRHSNVAGTGIHDSATRLHSTVTVRVGLDLQQRQQTQSLG